MKLKIILIVLATALLLAACGSKSIDSVTLLDDENNEVTFPKDKPVLFFFITTYT